MGWRCFMVRESKFARRSLRRYGGECSLPHHYHDVETVIDEQFVASDDEIGGHMRDEYKDDPRWPKACACGQVLHPEGNWQVNVHRLYEGALDGKLYPLRELPPGAIWRCDWMEDIKDNPYAGPDGKVWALMLPSGYEWLIYGPSSNGGKWTVTGELPNITVSPSIAQQGGSVYHGFVQGGVITEDCDGRKFPGLARTA